MLMAYQDRNPYAIGTAEIGGGKVIDILDIVPIEEGKYKAILPYIDEIEQLPDVSHVASEIIEDTSITYVGTAIKEGTDVNADSYKIKNTNLKGERP